MQVLELEKSGGFVKIYRKLLDSPLWIECTPERKTILITMILLANHSEKNVMLKTGEIVKVERGQFITSYRSLAEKCGKGVTKNHVESALRFFKKAQFCRHEQIQNTRQENRQTPTLVTIENWAMYQNNFKTTDNTPDNTQDNNKDGPQTEQEYKEYKEYNIVSDSKESDVPSEAFKSDNNNLDNSNINTITTKSKREKEKEKNSAKKKEKDQQIKEVVEYLNLKANRKYKPETAETKKLISARLKDYTVEDLKAVIDFKVGEWLENEKMNKFLRPSTLFRESNFENYINELPSEKNNNNVKKGRILSLEEMLQV